MFIVLRISALWHFQAADVARAVCSILDQFSKESTFPAKKLGRPMPVRQNLFVKFDAKCNTSPAKLQPFGRAK
jgi:hypothetical protein